MSQELNTVFNHNGKDYHFDVRDAENMMRFEKAVEALENREKECPKTGKASEMLKFQADIIKEFFDNCLGAGAGTDICTEKSNVGICYSAYQDFIDLINQQKNCLLNAGNTFRTYAGQKRPGRK